MVYGMANSREQLNRLLRRYSRLMPDAEFLIGCDPEAKHYILVTLLADQAGYRLKQTVEVLRSRQVVKQPTIEVVRISRRGS